MTMTWRMCLYVFFAWAFLWVGTSTANAALISTTNVDTLTQLDVVWTWNPEEPGTDVPLLTNWFVSLSLTGPVRGGPLDGFWIIDTEMRHVSDPHPLLGESGGGQSYYVWGPLFHDATGFGVVWDDPRMLADHSPLNRVHTDVFHLVFTRSPDPAQTVIQLTSQHVPEPGAFALLALAGLGFASRRKLH